MPHSNTVFRDVLKLVPWAEFERLVKAYGTEDFARFHALRSTLCRSACQSRSP